MRLCKRKCLTRHLTRGQRSVHFLKFKVLNLVSSPLPPPGLAYPQSHGQDEEEVQGQHRDVTCLQAPLGKGLQGVRRCGPRAAGAALHGAEHTLHPVEVTCASDAEPSTTLPCSLPAWDRQVGDTRSLPHCPPGTAKQGDARGGMSVETKLRVDSSIQHTFTQQMFTGRFYQIHS